MSDVEFDQDWKPNGRPQSTMAKSFSLTLDDLFKIDGSVADLDAAVHEKKKVVSTQTTELEALEARLKATEERLKLAATNNTKPSSGRVSPRPRVPLGDTFSQTPPHLGTSTSPLATDFESRSPTTSKGASDVSVRKGPPMPGTLPPTPGPSEDGESV